MYIGGHKKIASAANKKDVVVRGGGGNSEARLLDSRIKREVGDTLLFEYYFFLYKFGRDPLNLEDFYDGLRSLGIIVELESPRI
jgi:hypothetical protein